MVCKNCECGQYNKMSLGEATYSLQQCAGLCRLHPMCETFEYRKSGECSRCLDSELRESITEVIYDYEQVAVFNGKPGKNALCGTL